MPGHRRGPRQARKHSLLTRAEPPTARPGAADVRCLSRTLYALVAALLLTTGAYASGSDATATEFPTWSQDFGGDASGWIGQEVEGATGWCGSVEHRTAGSGAVEPSSGDGYGLALGGPCNAFSQAGGVESSGPYSFGAGYAPAWPEHGYEMRLDVYLDPEREVSFTYWTSISLLDVRGEAGPPRDEDPEGDLGDFLASLRYFGVPVEGGEGQITIGDDAMLGEEHHVDEAGWYTFRHSFEEGPDGHLEVAFQVARNDQTRFTASPAAAYTPEGAQGPSYPVDEIDAANVGAGYIWLALPAGSELPIDRHVVRAHTAP